MTQEMTRVVSTYLALLEAYPHQVIDISWLPADKKKLIEIFKILWLTANKSRNREMRKEAENYWCLLSLFQPNVGAVLIDSESSKYLTLKEWDERRDRLLRLLEIVSAEEKRYEREINRFKTVAAVKAMVAKTYSTPRNCERES